MLTLFALHLACSLHGLDGNLCVAVAVVESGLRPEAMSSAGAVGLMQVKPSVTPWPAWTLATVPGGAMAGAQALAYWHKHRPLRPLRGYCCGWKDSSPRCAEYEAKVKAVLRKIDRAASGRVALVDERCRQSPLRSRRMG